MSIPELYTIFLRHPGIVIDSRKAARNSLFFALKGEHADGNAFAANALENGCEFAVIDNPEYAGIKNCILVDDVLQTLQALALHHRKQFNIPCIGITGTNGKTTSKELISQVLATQYKVHATTGNHNNHIGVPLTLLSMPADTSMAIIEMGANHPGEIDLLCNIALPTHGMITNVGLAHLEGFGSLDGVIQTKTELYRFIDRADGVVFVNSGQKELLEQASLLQCKRIFYGSRKNDFCTGQFTGLDPFLSFELKTMAGKEVHPPLPIHTQLVGRYNLNNALSAACIGLYFGIEVQKVRQAVETYIPGNQRSQLLKTSRNMLILDHYNANPSSMQAALENFSEFRHPKKVLILGDMLELGEYAIAEHKHILEVIQGMDLHTVFLVGNFFEQASAGAQYNLFKNSTLLAEYLREHPIADAAVLIKGSRGIKLEKVVEYL